MFRLERVWVKKRVSRCGSAQVEMYRANTEICGSQCAEVVQRAKTQVLRLRLGMTSATTTAAISRSPAGEDNEMTTGINRGSSVERLLEALGEGLDKGGDGGFGGF